MKYTKYKNIFATILLIISAILIFGSVIVAYFPIAGSFSRVVICIRALVIGVILFIVSLLFVE